MVRPKQKARKRLGTLSIRQKYEILVSNWYEVFDGTRQRFTAHQKTVAKLTTTSPNTFSQKCEPKGIGPLLTSKIFTPTERWWWSVARAKSIIYTGHSSALNTGSDRSHKKPDRSYSLASFRIGDRRPVQFATSEGISNEASRCVRRCCANRSVYNGQTWTDTNNESPTRWQGR